MLTEQITPNTAAKKTWTEPKLHIIARNNVLAKSHPNVHEGTGNTVVTNGYTYFSNLARTSHVTLGKHGFPIGNKSSAAS